MARRAVISQSGVGTSAWVGLDLHSPLMTFAAVVSGGAATFTIEYTLDPVLIPAPAATAFSVPGMSAVTANTSAGFSTPIAAARINQTVGAGTVTLTIVQAGGSVV